MSVKMTAAMMKPALYLCTKSSNVFFCASLRFVSAFSSWFVLITAGSYA